MNKLWMELQRRNVVRVGGVYALVAWLLAQIADLVLGNFNAPSWLMQTFLFLLVAGFPVALIIGWAFELTPQGLRRRLRATSSCKTEHLHHHRHCCVIQSGSPQPSVWLRSSF